METVFKIFKYQNRSEDNSKYGKRSKLSRIQKKEYGKRHKTSKIDRSNKTPDQVQVDQVGNKKCTNVSLEILAIYYVSVNSKPDHPPWATPEDSHILVAPGVGFLLLCLAWGS